MPNNYKNTIDLFNTCYNTVYLLLTYCNVLYVMLGNYKYTNSDTNLKQS
jgi:hypothetical protein